MAADQLIVLVGLAPQIEVFAGQGLLLQGVADAQQDAVAVERLLQELEGPQLGGLDGVGDGALARDHDDLGRSGPGLDVLEDVQAVAARHHDVQQDDVDGRRLFEQAQAVLAVAGLQEDVALVLEDHLQGFADALLVVDDEDAGFSLGLHGFGPPGEPIVAHPRK